MKKTKNKSIKSIIIGDLEIGEADSRTEINKKGKNYYYYDGLKMYDKIKNNNSIYLISGRKGSGKSALVSKFHEYCLEKNILSKFIENNSLLSKMLSEVKLENISNTQLLICFYKYMILIEISKMILDELKGMKLLIYFFQSIKKLIFLPKMLKRLKLIINNCDNDFEILFKVNNICKNTNESLSQKGTSKATTIAPVKPELSFENQNKISKLTEINYTQKEFYDKVDVLFDTLIKINRAIPFNIIFDDIEDNRVFKFNNKFSSSFVEEFILIVNELNNKFIRYNSRIFIVIRDDILDLVNSSSNNINKIIEDHSINVNWINNYYSKMPPLIELIISKIINNNETLKDISAEEFYDTFLPKKIGDVSINNYIINATFGRPRDVVVMFKKIVEISNENKKFTEDSFKLSRIGYSEYFFREIKNELSMIIEEKDLINLFLVFKNLNKVDFNKNEIIEAFEKYEFSCFNDVNSFLTFCFEKSIIGILEKRSNGKNIYKWKYRNNEYLNVDADGVFYTLHRGISKVIIGK